jgi:hypothetical protein
MADTNLDVASIDRILSLAPAQTLQVDGFTYIDKDKKIEMHKPPMASAISLNTLSGFVALLESGVEGFDPTEVLVHVVGYEKVELISKGSDELGRRQTFVRADLLQQDVKFTFNQFYDQEAFNIGLRALFVPSTELDELQSISGNLAAKAEVAQEDDGITQRVTAKGGVHLVTEKVVKPRVTLAPYRTFREVEQPASDFIFRVRGGENGNKCALYEADGGFWRNKAIDNIKEWLSNQLKGSAVEGLSEIPIIA